MKLVLYYVASDLQWVCPNCNFHHFIKLPEFKDAVMQGRLLVCTNCYHYYGIEVGYVDYTNIQDRQSKEKQATKTELKICNGNDKTMLDESLAGHIFHCPNCDMHLTSLGLCSHCGTRYEIPVCLYTVRFNPERAICGGMVIGYYRHVPLCEKHLEMASRKLGCTCPLIDDNTMGYDPDCVVHGVLNYD